MAPLGALTVNNSGVWGTGVYREIEPTTLAGSVPRATVSAVVTRCDILLDVNGGTLSFKDSVRDSRHRSVC